MPVAAIASPELRAIGRFEWERLVRRIVMPWPVKSLALLLSTYADPDGSRVRPGLDALAGVTGESKRTVRRKMTVLRDDYGLLLRVSRGGGRGGQGRTADYRLAIPVDLLDRAELLSPGEHADDSAATMLAPQSDSTPVDNSDSGATQMSGQNDAHPVDNAESPATQMSHENDFQGTSDDTPEPIEGTFDHFEGTPRCPPTTHIDQPPTRPTLYSPPSATTDRASDDPEQNDLSGGGQPRASPAPAKCDHGLPAQRRPDGSPTCPICRRTSPAGAQPCPTR